MLGTFLIASLIFWIFALTKTTPTSKIFITNDEVICWPRFEKKGLMSMKGQHYEKLDLNTQITVAMIEDIFQKFIFIFSITISVIWAYFLVYAIHQIFFLEYVNLTWYTAIIPTLFLWLGATQLFCIILLRFFWKFLYSDYFREKMIQYLKKQT